MYDHIEKAGNQSDFVKHSALIAVADAIISESSGDFEYADIFAGYAFNPLRSNGEWRYGIGKLCQDSDINNVNVTFWRGLWNCKTALLGSVYPGSSLFIFKLCMSKKRDFRAQLWDTSPAVIKQLMETYNKQQVLIYPRPARLDDFTDCNPDLLLIDPPGLRTKARKQYLDLTELLRFFDIAQNSILYFPMTAKGRGTPVPETESSKRAKYECLSRGLSVTSIRWSNGIRTCGCRLAYKLANPSTANALRSAVDEVVRLMKWDASPEHE